MKFRMKPLAAVVAFTAAGLTMPAIADGILEGRVSDVQNETVYTGAVVRIDELNREVLAGKGGRFRMPSLTAGEYTLQVIVGGKLIDSRTITVADKEVKNLDIVLNNAEEPVEEILVVGQAAQLQRGLDRQRYADNTISVINADAIGQLPDTNAAEALQRVPGISIERDQGEGRFVRVRGISPDLNSVTVNGTQLPAPEAGRRAVALDVMPSDLISALVVTKTLTPDMDANAIGGSIEVESLSALDREGAFYTLRAGASYDEQTDQTSPNYGISGGNTFLLGNGQRLGVAGAFSYNDRKFGSENVETGAHWDEGSLEEFEIRDYDIERKRIGAALNFDLEIDASNRLYLRNLYSSFKDFETRQASVIEFANAQTPGASGDAEVARELKDREEKQTILSTTFGGEHFIQDWTVEYALGYSKSEEENPGGLSGAAFTGEFSDMGFSNSRKPRLSAPASYYDASSYEIDEVEYEETLTDDTQSSLRFDITRDLFIADYPSQVKFGGKYKTREKTNDEDVFVYEDFNGETLDNFSTSVDYDLSEYGPGISPSAIYSLIDGMDKAEALENAGADSRIADYTVNEDITAAYVMANAEINDLFILAGIRYEHTKHDFDGMQYNDDDESYNRYKDDNSYSHVLPNIQARYKLTEDTQVRAAWTNSVVRPTFEQMAPSLSSEGDEAEAGNPQLDAMTAANFDLGIEHYTGTAGAVSASVFYKDIDDFIFQADIRENAGYEEYTGGVESYDNGKSASLTGVELSASQKMEMLPAPFDGLLISANATYTDSEAELQDGRKIDLPSQSELTGNLVIGYEKNGLSLRLASNYKSEYLMEVGNLDDDLEDVYQSSQTQLDFSAAYDITQQLKVNFDIANITDEPYYTYQRSSKYNAQYEDYGPTYRLGLTFTNF